VAGEISVLQGASLRPRHVGWGSLRRLQYEYEVPRHPSHLNDLIDFSAVSLI
jgi:hypothetical protein